MTDTDILTTIIDIIAEAANIDAALINPEKTLAENGIAPFDGVEAMIETEHEFGVELPDAFDPLAATPRGLATLVDTLSAAVRP